MSADENTDTDFHVRSLSVENERNYSRELEIKLQKEQQFLGPDWVLVTCVPTSPGSRAFWMTVWRRM